MVSIQTTPSKLEISAGKTLRLPEYGTQANQAKGGKRRFGPGRSIWCPERKAKGKVAKAQEMKLSFLPG